MVYILFEVSSTVFVWQIRWTLLFITTLSRALGGKKISRLCWLPHADRSLVTFRGAVREPAVASQNTGHWGAVQTGTHPALAAWKWGEWVLKDCWSSAVRTAEDLAIRTDNASKRKTQVKPKRCFGSWVNNKKCSVCIVEKSTRN